MELSQAEIQEKAKASYDYVMQFINDNRSYAEVKQFLIDDGMDEATAKSVISAILKLKKQHAKEEMKAGAMFLVSGIIVTILSFFFPLKLNGHNYNVLFTGIIIFGAIKFFKGLANSK
jgi:hypothetical protein